MAAVQPNSAPTALPDDLEERLSKLMSEEASDDLPPLGPEEGRSLMAQPGTVAERIAALQQTQQPAPAATRATAAAAPRPAAAAPTEAPPAPIVAAAPMTLVPRPMTNLTPAEKRDASHQAELFSILVTMEHLEGAFVKGVVPNEEYESYCKTLLTQFKTLQAGLHRDIGLFIKEQEMQCPLAESRLLGTGMAATALHGTATSGSHGKEARTFAQATEQFITLTNALSINYRSAFELLPLVQELQTSIVAIPNLPPLAGLERITGWLVTLHNMRACDSLDEDQVKQLTLDVSLAYTSFQNHLSDM